MCVVPASKHRTRELDGLVTDNVRARSATQQQQQ